jgi:hypothetical protein
VSTCVKCNTTCGLGWRKKMPWPSNSSFYSVCEPCPKTLPENAMWVDSSQASFMECAYKCMDRYFHMQDQCMKCSNRTVCEDPGYQLMACTTLSDSHCEIPCKNDTKAAFNSKAIHLKSFNHFSNLLAQPTFPQNTLN